MASTITVRASIAYTPVGIDKWFGTQSYIYEKREYIVFSLQD